MTTDTKTKEKIINFIQNYTSDYYSELPTGVYDGDINSLAEDLGVSPNDILTLIDDGTLYQQELYLQNPEVPEYEWAETLVTIIGLEKNNQADVEYIISHTAQNHALVELKKHWRKLAVSGEEFTDSDIDEFAEHLCKEYAICDFMENDKKEILKNPDDLRLFIDEFIYNYY